MGNWQQYFEQLTEVFNQAKKKAHEGVAALESLRGSVIVDEVKPGSLSEDVFSSIFNSAFKDTLLTSYDRLINGMNNRLVEIDRKYVDTELKFESVLENWRAASGDDPDSTVFHLQTGYNISKDEMLQVLAMIRENIIASLTFLYSRANLVRSLSYQLRKDVPINDVPLYESLDVRYRTDADVESITAVELKTLIEAVRRTLRVYPNTHSSEHEKLLRKHLRAFKGVLEDASLNDLKKVEAMAILSKHLEFALNELDAMATNIDTILTYFNNIMSQENIQ